MAVGPNFTGVDRTNDTVRVLGESGGDFNDIVSIQVILAQGDRIERKTVQKLGSVWDVEFPSDGFDSGFATAFGWETRKDNFTTTSWVETVKIPEPGGPP
jgi:hypothetical protein